MTYGINVTNSAGRTLLDTDYPLFYPTTNTPVSTSAVSYPTGLLSGDLVIGRPSTIGDSIGPARWYSDQSAHPFTYYILRQSGVVTPPSSGYGVLVKDSVGGTVFASTNQQKMFYVAACGVLSPTSTDTGRFPATGTVPDLDKYYVVVNNTLISISASPFGVSGWIVAYFFNWVSGTEGYIGATNSSFYGTDPSQPRIQPMSYMILKEVG